MPFCPNCGKPLKEGERYCFSCGTKIVPVTQKSADGLNVFDVESPQRQQADNFNEKSIEEDMLFENRPSENREMRQADEEYERMRYERASGDTGFGQDENQYENREENPNVVPEKIIIQTQAQEQPKKKSFFSRIGKILEILLYIFLIFAAYYAIRLLNQFANQINFNF